MHVVGPAGITTAASVFGTDHRDRQRQQRQKEAAAADRESPRGINAGTGGVGRRTSTDVGEQVSGRQRWHRSLGSVITGAPAAENGVQLVALGAIQPLAAGSTHAGAQKAPALELP